ncbi:MAG: hypothetical protein EOM40_09460 [Clostridia bacterium]|nr:hypothetical protein [Clostridia bacterium]NCC42398.1 hypothetical protein [Clostridia bacterium]
MMKKKVKKGSALLLALMLTLSAVPLMSVQGANSVEVDRLCSVDFSIAGEFENLKSVEGGVQIKLYKVASMDSSGAYTVEPDFDGVVDVASLENTDTSADEWSTRAEAAKTKIDESGITTSADLTTATNANGEASMSNIPVGLYLVDAEQAMTPNYLYDFEPYLISLPNNYYYQTGSDDWIYDLSGTNALSLKPQETERFGDLVINKSLTNHHVTMGERASFVFQVDITTPKDESITKFIQLSFDGTGNKQAMISDIPAGSAIRVEEVYTGAGYELTSDPEQTTEIAADDVAGVEFTNAHDGHITGGYGVVNNFVLDENNMYTWNQLNDNSAAQE